MSERLVIEKALQERRVRLLALLNVVTNLPGAGEIYEKTGRMNVLHIAKEEIEDLEKMFPELGLKVRGEHCVITVASLLATVTQVLCGRRLCFNVEDVAGKVVTMGFGWWKDPNAPAKGSKDRGAVDFWCDDCELGFGDQELDGNNCPVCGDNIVDSGDVREEPEEMPLGEALAKTSDMANEREERTARLEYGFDFKCGRCGEVFQDAERRRLDPEDPADYCKECIEIVAHGGQDGDVDDQTQAQ